MLVLSRKAGESIRIGNNITIVINRIAGNRVTLGLEAPRNMRIIRGELRPFDEPPVPEEATEESSKAAQQGQQSSTPAPVTSQAESEPGVTVCIDSDVMSYLSRRAR